MCFSYYVLCTMLTLIENVMNNTRNKSRPMQEYNHILHPTLKRLLAPEDEDNST